MTFHTGNTWVVTDPIDNAPIAAIAQGIRAHNYAPPLCYGVFSTADMFILNLSKFLVQHQDQVITRKALEAYIPEDAEGVGEHWDVLIEVGCRVMAELNLLDEEFTEEKKVPFKYEHLLDEEFTEEKKVPFKYEHPPGFDEATAKLAEEPGFKETVNKIVEDLKTDGKSSGVFKMKPGDEDVLRN